MAAIVCPFRVTHCSNFDYKPQTVSHQQHLDLYIDRLLRSLIVMIAVTSCHMECTDFNLDCSQMPLRNNGDSEKKATSPM